MVETYLKQIQYILQNEEQHENGLTKVRTTYLLNTKALDTK